MLQDKPDLEFRQRGIQQLRGPNFTLLKISTALPSSFKSRLESNFAVEILSVSLVGFKNSSKILQEFL